MLRPRAIRAVAAAIAGLGLLLGLAVRGGPGTSPDVRLLGGGGDPDAAFVTPGSGRPARLAALERAGLIHVSGRGAGAQPVVGPMVRDGVLGKPLTSFCTPGSPTPAQSPPGVASGGTGGMRKAGAAFVGLRQGQSPTAIAFGGDVSGAAGASDYVETINDAIGIYSRSGERRCPVVDTTTLWTGSATPCDAPGASYTDAIVLWDRRASRWFISRFLQSGTQWYQCVVVSQTKDPTGGYFRYAFQISSKDMPYFNDYEKFGIWRDAYYMTSEANQIFRPNGKGIFVNAFDRNAMLQGHAAKEVEFFLPVQTNPGNPAQDLGVQEPSMLQPADVDGPNQPPAGSPEFLVQALDDNLGWGVDQLVVWAFKVRWANPGASTLKITSQLSVDPFNSNPCVPAMVHSSINQQCVDQKGTSQNLDSLAYGYLGYRLAYRRFTTAPQNLQKRDLMLAQTVVVGSDVNHTGIRWYILGQLPGGMNASWRLAQSGTYSPDDDNRWLPSPAMDASGDLAIGFTVSGAKLFPTARYAGRRVTDAPNKLPRDEATLAAGQGPQTNNAFFGDYTQLVLDPNDDCKLWFAAPYYRNKTAGASHDFSTAVGRFSFKSCT